MAISKVRFGSLPSGRDVNIYTLTSPQGVCVRVLSMGAILQGMFLPDRGGNFADVILGFDNLQGYLNDTSSQGAIIGRYANRIRDGKFRLADNSYQLIQNENTNCLHGGNSLRTKIWDVEEISKSDRDILRLSVTSPHGECGFPGELNIVVEYILLHKENALILSFYGECDRDTIFNPTNHMYLNLFGSGDVLEHLLQIPSCLAVPVDTHGLPAGGYRNIKSTPLDFTEYKSIGQDIAKTEYDLISNCHGYDVSYILDDSITPIKLYDPKSGRGLSITTDFPAVQLYSGNFLNESSGKGKVPLTPLAGLCLEAQFPPDSPNQADFPQCVLHKGERFKKFTKLAWWANL